MQYQLGFNKVLINITLNTMIKYFRTIHTYILEPAMMYHHIIIFLQFQDQTFQNGTAY